MTIAEKKQLKVGDRIVYTDDHGARIEATVRDAPQRSGSGHWLVWVSGRTGGYLLNRVIAKCSCGADRTGPSAEAHSEECPAK